jgi:general secretion pathway protein J
MSAVSHLRKTNTALSVVKKARLVSGFTLLEVMIAISIFAILSAGAFRLLSGEIVLQQRLDSHHQALARWQRGIHRLRTDLAQALPRSVHDADQKPHPAMVGRSDSITFTRGGWVNPMGQARSELQRLSYQLETASTPNDTLATNALLDDEQTQWLSRHAWRSLDGNDTLPDQRQFILPHIESIQLRYLVADTNTWKTQWPPANSQLGKLDSSLPAAIEVNIKSQRFGATQHLIDLRTRDFSANKKGSQ